MAIKLKVNEEPKKLDRKHNSDAKNSKHKNAKFKYEIVESKSPLKKARKILFIFACIAIFISLNLMLAPYITAFFGLILLMIWLVIILVGTVVTVGVVWTIEGFRNFSNWLMSICQACFNGTDKIIDIVKAALPYLGSICGTILVASLTLSTICFAKEKKGNNIALFVLNIAFSFLFVIFTVFAALIKK